MIPGDLLSAFPHRQFHTLPGLLDSWAALPNSNSNACMPMQGGSLCHFYDCLWYDPAERRTHDLPCERRTSYRLTQPDTVQYDLTDIKKVKIFTSTLTTILRVIALVTLTHCDYKQWSKCLLKCAAIFSSLLFKMACVLSFWSQHYVIFYRSHYSLLRSLPITHMQQSQLVIIIMCHNQLSRELS